MQNPDINNLKTLKNINVLFDRAIKRIKEPLRKSNRQKARTWCKANAVNTIDYIKSLDEDLANEAIEYNDELVRHANKIYDTIPFTMGGGADSILIYFFTRYFRPDIVVETGVSMGFSSHAFLSAFLKNAKGELYSSDLPYFLEENPEKYVGCMVPEKLKKSWNLYLKGDKKNLKLITKKINKIDIFHYDSDKSYSGRKFALKKINQLLNADSLIIIDDIDVNLHFKDYCENHKNNSRILRKLNGDYVGIVLPKSYKTNKNPFA